MTDITNIQISISPRDYLANERTYLAWLRTSITLIGIGIFPNLASLLYAIIFVLIIYIPANYLFKKKIFIKL